MKTILPLIALVISFTVYSQQTNETMDVGGATRDYIQYLPVGFDSNTESLPVVLILHGLGDNATNMTNIGANIMADTARFIAIYPQGLINGFGQTAWSNGTLLAPAGADDLTFMHQLIDDAILNQNADPSRIYATGFSMGSIMSYKLACAMNNRIAAIGAMSGPMSTEDLNNCVPSYVTPVMHLHGTNDGTVPYDSNPLPSLSLVPETIDFWINAHGCSTTADSTQLPDNAADGYTVDRFVYQSCTPQESLEFWRINGAGHEYMYEPANDFTEFIEVWHFLRKWQHAAPAAAGISTLAKYGFAVAPNPSNGRISIQSDIEMDLTVTTIIGNVCANIHLNKGESTHDLSYLSPGVYLLTNGRSTTAQRIVIE